MVYLVGINPVSETVLFRPNAHTHVVPPFQILFFKSSSLNFTRHSPLILLIGFEPTSIHEHRHDGAAGWGQPEGLDVPQGRGNDAGARRRRAVYVDGEEWRRMEKNGEEWRRVEKSCCTIFGVQCSVYGATHMYWYSEMTSFTAYAAS